MSINICNIMLTFQDITWVVTRSSVTYCVCNSNILCNIQHTEGRSESTVKLQMPWCFWHQGICSYSLDTINIVSHNGWLKISGKHQVGLRTILVYLLLGHFSAGANYQLLPYTASGCLPEPGHQLPNTHVNTHLKYSMNSGHDAGNISKPQEPE